MIDRDASVDKGENARLTSFMGAIAVADLVKTTLGPKGMDKILQSVRRVCERARGRRVLDPLPPPALPPPPTARPSLTPPAPTRLAPPQMSNPSGDIVVTNDGATILRSIVVDNPAAKVLIDIAKTQDDEVGDGTTSVTVLAGELLREAEKLIALRIHPMVIIEGWRRAAEVARAALEASSLDHSADASAFREDLLNIARTTLSSKLLTHEKDKFGALRCRGRAGVLATRGAYPPPPFPCLQQNLLWTP